VPTGDPRRLEAERVAIVPRIEFFYCEDCPSHDKALERLRAVAGREGITAPIVVVLVESDEDAHRYGFFGSPTIRVDGVDIAPLPDGIPQPALGCRAYRTPDGRISPLPPYELIAAALQRFAGNARKQSERNDQWPTSSTVIA
jgi:hypothetical protein